jgi:hypothetical protein
MREIPPLGQQVFGLTPTVLVLQAQKRCGIVIPTAIQKIGWRAAAGLWQNGENS